jgi:hypothetical protein
MPVENIGAVQPSPPPGTDNRMEPAANQAQQTQQTQPQPQRPERAPLPEASGWNVDLFA